MPRVIITQKGQKPQPYRLKLDREIIKLGRAQNNDIQFTGGSTSSHHCEIKRVKGGYILEDLDSTNGIKQEETKFEIIDLFDGSEVIIGDVELNFELTEEEIEELAEEGRFKKRQRASLPKTELPKEEIQAVELEEAPSHKKKSKKASPDSTRAKPTTAPVEPPHSSHIPTPSSGTTPLLLLILAVIAIFIGMSIRHYIDHKTMLYEEIIGNTY